MGRKKVYIHKVAAIKFSKTHLLKNPKKTYKPNNHNLIHD